MQAYQKRIADWLQKRAPELAAVYQGAVRLAEDGTYPGRMFLICHASRDICNRLPDLIGVAVVSYNQTKQLNVLSDLWVGHKLGAALEQISLSGTGTAETSTREISLPLEVFKHIDSVVKHHQNIPRINRDKALKMFEAVAPETTGRREVTGPQIEQWMELKRWFQEHAHAGLADRAADHKEVETNFQILEAHLSKIAGEEFYEAVEALDEILEDSNS